MIFNSAPTFPVGTTRYEVWREDKCGRWNFESDFTNNEAARLFIEERIAFGHKSRYQILKAARMSPEVQFEMADKPANLKTEPVVPNQGKPLLTIAEAAALCGVSRPTFYVLMKRENFQMRFISDRTRRVLRSSVEEYLNKQKIPA